VEGETGKGDNRTEERRRRNEERNVISGVCPFFVPPSSFLGFPPPFVNQGRVERWRGGLRLRFHLPLIEPDGRISRIRLSDKGFLVGFVMLSPTEGYRQLGYPLAEPLNGPLTSECFYDDPFVSSLRLLPAEATQLPGGPIVPLEPTAFSRRTEPQSRNFHRKCTYERHSERSEESR
jgi:hypothetical protein